MSMLAVSGQARRCVSAGGGRTNAAYTDGDLATVSLVGDAIDLLEIVRVGDDLVAGNDVLRKRQSHSSRRERWIVRGRVGRGEGQAGYVARGSTAVRRLTLKMIMVTERVTLV